MSTSRKSERRALSQDEFDLVAKTHRPAIADLKGDELTQLIGLLRERRDRARDIANKQRRRIRGKDRGARAAPPEQADAGNRRKAAILGEALSRLSEERSRRTRSEFVASAHKALAMKRAAVKPARPASGRTAKEGMTPKPKTKAKRIGSAMEAGRVSQAVRDAQAKRDAR